MPPELERVGVLFGGPSPEHDVSVLTGLQAGRELSASSIAGQVTGLYWSTSGEFFEVAVDLEASAFAAGVPAGASPLRLVVAADGGFVARGALGRERTLGLPVVLNCCHGGPGEDGTLSAVLDAAGVRYAGPSVAGAALGMDKLSFGALVSSAGLPTLDRALLTRDGEIGFPGPYIVKPRYGGSSIGIDVVADADTARARLDANPHLRAGAVVEPYRRDLFDLNVAMRAWPEPSQSAIEKPIRRGDGAEILDYADKYVGGEGMVSAPREIPARIDVVVEKMVRDAARSVAELAAVRGVARLDFLSNGSELYVNELNTVPGSLAKHLWVDPPLPFGELLAGMLEEALKRPAARYSSAGADGTVLRSAGSIAAKLG